MSNNFWIDIGVALAIVLAVFFLILNLIFRVRLLKLFKKMQQRRIEMPWKWLFDRNKRKKWVHPKYPDDIQLIERFSAQLQSSLRWGGIVFITLSSLAAWLVFS